MSGKRALAPCGHEGEYVIGQYVQCETCDKAAVPEELEDTSRITKRLCAHCGSDDIQKWPGLWATGETLYWCNGCEASFK